MKPQFVETIKIKDGNAQALTYHQARMERTIQHFFPSTANEITPSLEQTVVPHKDMELYKARVVYGELGIEQVEYAPYSMRTIHSLKIVEDNTIEYGFKSADRSCINVLTTKKGTCDDIIIVKRGLVRDTSFTNLAICDGNQWITPKHPLLLGTKRQYLLDNGLIAEADITLADLKKAEKIALFNAMIELGEIVISIDNVKA